MDTLIDMSEVSMQTKIILEIQVALKKMQDDQQLMIDHIKDLENTVIMLAEESEETDSYKYVEEKARKIKKKRKINNRKMKAKHEEKSEKLKSELRQSKRLEKPSVTKLTILRPDNQKQTKEKESSKQKSNKAMDVEKQKNDRVKKVFP